MPTAIAAATQPKRVQDPELCHSGVNNRLDRGVPSKHGSVCCTTP
ncbi:unnamed protein product [Penicillium camemberti]|uniref:Str. FM013 n=1 Tax=Penicillium camemberti (strain FM 013) TaxID=1429867 RepID=A0A0G4NXD4_PENC3|nr:unnamed protein product [Penicillium camemberti]